MYARVKKILSLDDFQVVYTIIRIKKKKKRKTDTFIVI